MTAKTAETVDYANVTNTPTIPADVSDLTDNTSLLFDGDYNSLSNLPTLFDGDWSSLTGTAPNVSIFNNDAGYLTRRLVDVAQDVIIIEEDCCTPNGIRVTAIEEGNEIKVPLSERISGRVAVNDVYEPGTTNLLFKAGELITEEEAAKVMCKELSDAIKDEELSKFFDFINFQESYHIELMKKLL